MSFALSRSIAAFSALSAAALIPAGAHAQQAPLTQTVWFEVPVKLVDIHPSVKSFSVQCHLGPYFMREDIDFDRNYSGVVKLKSKPIANEVASQIKEWDCNLRFFPAQGKGQTPSFTAQNDMFKAKAGSKLVTEVKGAIGSAQSPPPVKAQPLVLPQLPLVPRQY